MLKELPELVTEAPAAAVVLMEMLGVTAAGTVGVLTVKFGYVPEIIV